jgi:hypothetical protein
MAEPGQPDLLIEEGPLELEIGDEEKVIILSGYSLYSA